MNKALRAVTALLLALLLLSGCALRPASMSDTLRNKLSQLSKSSVSDTLRDKLSQLFESAGSTASAGGKDADKEAVHNPDGLKFSEMRYARPDTEKLGDDVAAVMAAIERGAGLEELETLLDACMEDYDHFDTMCSLANIYNAKDMRDEYYAAEFEWCSARRSTVSQLFEEMYYACALSPLGAALEEDYFWEGFCEEYSDPDDSRYTDATVALMQRESELISRYRELVADPVVTWRGEERSVHELLDSLSGFSYLQVLLLYYEAYNEPLAEVYIELMRVRCEMAEEMGYDSCEAMEYDFGFGRDYSPEDAARFIDDIRSYLVPLYTWTQKQNLSAARAYSPLSTEELYAGLRAITASIGGDCAEAFSFMRKYELCDVEPSLYKADISFEDYLNDYDCPFVFINPTGTTVDLMTFAHEFGHFTDSYVNFGAVESIDLAECFSQGLEFLSLWHLDGVLGDEEIEALRLSQTLEALVTFVQQGAFAAFESRAHALGPDELSAEKLNELALETAKEFGICGAGYERFYQYYWMDITHFFEFPFYVISYPVSLDIAMQFYELELEREGQGLEKYFEILPRDYDSFTETIEKGGMTSPFVKDGLRRVAEAIAETVGYKGQLAYAA